MGNAGTQVFSDGWKSACCSEARAHRRVSPGRYPHLEQAAMRSVVDGATHGETGGVLSLPTGMEYHFFLSFSQATGADQMDTLCLELSVLGYRCAQRCVTNAMSRIISKTRKDSMGTTEQQMSSGEDKKQDMADDVRRSAVVILFLSRGVLQRRFVQLEMRRALAEKKPILLMHEDESHHDPFDFMAEAVGVPEDSKFFRWDYSENPVYRQRSAGPNRKLL